MYASYDQLEDYYCKHDTRYPEEPPQVHPEAAFYEQVTEQHRKCQPCYTLDSGSGACFGYRCREEKNDLGPFPEYHKKGKRKYAKSLPFIDRAFNALLNILLNVLDRKSTRLNSSHHSISYAV